MVYPVVFGKDKAIYRDLKVRCKSKVVGDSVSSLNMGYNEVIKDYVVLLAFEHNY